MYHFHTLSKEEKILHHQQLLQSAMQFGGKNFFLTLLESIRETKPHPLMSGTSRFDIELGSIQWNKVIFKDKLQLLIKARTQEGKQNNLLPDKETQGYKKIHNMIRTLKPIVFHIIPANSEDCKGFFLQPFDMIDKDTTKLNPLFDAIFFCSIDTVKKILNYTEST